MVTLALLLSRCSSPSHPFGAHTPFAERVAALAPELGAEVIGADPEDLDQKRGRLLAGRFRQGRGWSFERTGLPDVAWDRTFQWGEGKHLRPFLRRRVPLLNPRRLDKWEAHLALAASPRLRPHLPETERAEGAEQVQALLDRHSRVYLKPIRGSVGRGIVQMTRGGPDRFQLRYISEETGQLREVSATHGQLDRWLARRPGRYLAQQGLDLRIWEDRPADLRALVQKDGQGRWTLTGMGVRLAAPGRFTTNLHTGGDCLPVESLVRRLGLPACFPDELQQLALDVAGAIDQAAGGAGELGLDFGLDREGRIWFIEQNGQPGRSIFERLGCTHLAEQAYRRPVEYALHLAETRYAKKSPQPAT